MQLKSLTALTAYLLLFLVLPVHTMGNEFMSEGPYEPFALRLLAPDAEVVNIADPEFGNRIGGGDYGLVSPQALEVGPGVGQKPTIRIFRTRSRLRLSSSGYARFQVKTSDTEYIYFWIESPPVGGSWNLQLTATYADGHQNVLFKGDMFREGLYFSSIPPRSLLDFKITSKEKKRELNRRFTFTVSPVDISIWNGVRPVPYSIIRGSRQ